MSVTPVRKNSSILWNIVKILVALILVGFILSKTDFEHLSQTLRSVSIPWLIASIIAYLVLTALKALQYYLLLGEGIPYPEVLNIVVVQNTISNFLTVSAGIASYLASLRVEHGVKVSRSLILFILTKIGDLVAIWVFVLVTSLLVWSKIEVLHVPVLVLLALLGAALAVFFLTIVYRQRFISLINSILDKLKLSHIGIIVKGMDVLASLAETDFTRIVKLMRAMLVISFIYMGITIGLMYASLMTFNLEMSVNAVAFVTVMNQLVSYFPVQVFGGLGIYEMSSLYLFGLFTPAHDVLISALIGTRILIYVRNLVPLLYLPVYAFFFHTKGVPSE
ncbi:MAG: lysylphosphatidylglycerol synthase transmembrane domain-containing protein [Anaerolineales bacterium]